MTRRYNLGAYSHLKALGGCLLVCVCSGQLLWGATQPDTGETPPGTNTLTVTFPKTRHIYQRDASNQATLRIQGNWSGSSARLEARAITMAGATNTGVSTAWTVISQNPTNGPFTAYLSGVAAGGWYRLEVRAVNDASEELLAAGVDRIGVGDVVITAGQSNAACFGSPSQRPTDDRVSTLTLASGIWRLAADPQPDNSGGMGTGGSPWPALGSMLVRSNHVPVGLICVAYGGTELSQWAPGSGLYRNLTNALRFAGSNGVRAVLWHQGESDALANTTAAIYAQRLSNIVAQSRIAAGWIVPWGVAEASFHPSATRAQEEAVAAGQRLLMRTLPAVFRGARTDDFNLQGKLSDTVHFNAAGLADHAQQWANALCGIEDLALKNGAFEANTRLPEGSASSVTRVIGWNRLNSAGTGLATGASGYFNPGTNSYPGAGDTASGGILPNMNGPHVGTLNGGTSSNAFFQTINARLQPNTVYTLSASVGVRADTNVFGGYCLEILANDAALGGAWGDATTLGELSAGSVTGAFTIVSCVYTSGVSVPEQQQLAIRITKPGGAGTCLDVDNVRFTRQVLTYGQWQKLYWNDPADQEAAPEADPDQDGLPNLLESQLAGMNPHSPRPAPLPITIFTNGETYLELKLSRNPESLFGQLGVAVSSDLAAWGGPDQLSGGKVSVIDTGTELTLLVRRADYETLFFRPWASP